MSQEPEEYQRIMVIVAHPDDMEFSAGGTGGGLVRTIVGLAIVIGVIYGLYWILKLVKAARVESATGDGRWVFASLA
jgi:flagellar protein FliO/FliZ